MPTIDDADLDNAVDDSGFAHESVANTDNDNASVLKQGYSYERHPLNMPPAILIVDNFEESLYEDQGNTLSDYYTGDVASLDRNTNSPVKEGNYSLKATAQASATFSTSLNALLDQDETMAADVWVEGSDAVYVLYFVQDTNNFYQAGWSRGNDILALWHVNGGTFNKLEEDPYTADSTDWHRFEINPQSNGTHDVRLFDETDTQVASISPTDSNYTDGGVGVRSFSDTAAWDGLRLI